MAASGSIQVLYDTLVPNFLALVPYLTNFRIAFWSVVKDTLEELERAHVGTCLLAPTLVRPILVPCW